MIYTVTANPSIDYYMVLHEMCLGGMNRAHSTYTVPGGKGINVAIMLRRLDVACRALGFVGGAEGDWIRQMLAENGVEDAFIKLEETHSRVNVKLCAQEETELNAPGPFVPPQALDALCVQVERMAPDDVLAIGGSGPCGAPADYYAGLLRAANAAGVRTVVDSSGEPLRAALREKPWLVKPNAAELEELAGHSLGTLDAIISAMRAVQAHGARNVLASIGYRGAVLLLEDGDLWGGAPAAGTACSTVGAGDSMVAGFLAGWETTRDPLHALRLSLAASSASVFAQWLAEADAVERCFRKLPELNHLC